MITTRLIADGDVGTVKDPLMLRVRHHPFDRSLASKRHSIHVALGLLGALAALGCAPAQAELVSPWSDHPNSRVRLVVGDARTIGVELVLAPGWKTYWRMPGDAGVPPAFDWTGSINLASPDVLYPAPSAMPDAGGIAIGYKTAVTFPVRLIPSVAGQTVQVKLSFSFGVCREICIPVDANLSVDVPAVVDPGQQAPQINAALARVPRVVEDAARTEPGLIAIRIRTGGTNPGLRFEARNAQDVFIEAPDGLFVPMATKVTGPDNIAVFEIDLTKAPDLADLKGKPLRVTLVGAAGGVETTIWMNDRDR